MTRWDGVSDPRFDAYEGLGERDRRVRRADSRVDGKQISTAAGGSGGGGNRERNVRRCMMQLRGCSLWPFVMDDHQSAIQHRYLCSSIHAISTLTWRG